MTKSQPSYSKYLKKELKKQEELYTAIHEERINKENILKTLNNTTTMIHKWNDLRDEEMRIAKDRIVQLEEKQ